MLARARLAVVTAAGLLAVAVQAPAADAQVEPAPIDCQAVPTAAECSDEGSSPAGGDQSGNPAPVCRFDDTTVPCQTPYGFWVGDVVDGDWFGMDGDTWPALLVGCWATVSSPDRDPPADYHGQAEGGSWHTVSCLGPGGAWPVPGPVQFGLAWAPATADAPDAQALARRALASIDLRPPEPVVSPPETGSVLLGMPLWLAVDETAAGWGPITSQVCEQDLCVEVTATAARIQWRMSDTGPTVVCGREQNRAWQPGMDFLSPGDACHHYFTTSSRGRPGDRFRVTATVIWRASWSGAGESGTFVDLTDVCGGGSDEPCQSRVDVRVDELHVLGRR